MYFFEFIGYNIFECGFYILKDNINNIQLVVGDVIFYIGNIGKMKMDVKFGKEF